MIIGLLIRLLGIGFALIQVALLLRLLLPFVDPVPRALRPLVRPLVEITDALIAPFSSFAQPFDLASIVELPGGVEAILQDYVDRIDPAVVVAMVAWGIIGFVVMLVLRILFRR
jgi:hypothetical protein